MNNGIQRLISSDSVCSAASTAQLEEPDNIFLCPISLELMKDPVILSDGFSYERVNIENWLKLRRTSPMTNEPYKDNPVVLTPNISLRQAIAADRARRQQDAALNKAIRQLPSPPANDRFDGPSRPPSTPPTQQAELAQWSLPNPPADATRRSGDSSLQSAAAGELSDAAVREAIMAQATRAAELAPLSPLPEEAPAPALLPLPTFLPTPTLSPALTFAPWEQVLSPTWRPAAVSPPPVEPSPVELIPYPQQVGPAYFSPSLVAWPKPSDRFVQVINDPTFQECDFEFPVACAQPLVFNQNASWLGRMMAVAAAGGETYLQLAKLNAAGNGVAEQLLLNRVAAFAWHPIDPRKIAVSFDNGMLATSHLCDFQPLKLFDSMPASVLSWTQAGTHLAAVVGNKVLLMTAPTSSREKASVLISENCSASAITSLAWKDTTATFGVWALQNDNAGRILWMAGDEHLLFGSINTKRKLPNAPIQGAVAYFGDKPRYAVLSDETLEFGQAGRGGYRFKPYLRLEDGPWNISLDAWGQRLVAVSPKALHIYSLASGVRLVELIPKNPVLAVALSRDGTRIATYSRAGGLRFNPTRIG